MDTSVSSPVWSVCFIGTFQCKIYYLFFFFNILASFSLFVPLICLIRFLTLWEKSVCLVNYQIILTGVYAYSTLTKVDSWDRYRILVMVFLSSIPCSLWKGSQESILLPFRCLVFFSLKPFRIFTLLLIFWNIIFILMRKGGKVKVSFVTGIDLFPRHISFLCSTP